MPRCLIIAGPNGAGKTTFALDYLLRAHLVSNFINADLIAQGLSPLAPERQKVLAARLFLQEVDKCIERLEDFAFETTLSGKAYLKLIERLRSEGWIVELYYLALPGVEMSKSRVAERVAHGGHNIPLMDIERRFPRSLRNLLNYYSIKVSKCFCYMNADDGPELIFSNFGDYCKIFHPEYFNEIWRLSEL